MMIWVNFPEILVYLRLLSNSSSIRLAKVILYFCIFVFLSLCLFSLCLFYHDLAKVNISSVLKVKYVHQFHFQPTGLFSVFSIFSADLLHCLVHLLSAYISAFILDFQYFQLICYIVGFLLFYAGLVFLLVNTGDPWLPYTPGERSTSSSIYDI